MEGNRIIGKHAWEIEDFLQSKNVFENGITGKPAHSDSYMTVIGYTNLIDALDNNEFTEEQWLDSAEYWESQNYLSPIIGLLGRAVKRYFKEKI